MPFSHSADTLVPARAAQQIDELVVMLIVRVIILTAPAAASSNRLGPHAGRYHGTKVAPEKGQREEGGMGHGAVCVCCVVVKLKMQSCVQTSN